MYEYKTIRQADMNNWVEETGNTVKQCHGSFDEYLNFLAQDDWELLHINMKYYDNGTYYAMLRRTLPDVEQMATETQEILDAHGV